MGDLASDHDAAIKLIIGEYYRLNAHNPKHELLQYITNVNSQGFENVRDNYEEFLDRFETPEDKKLDHVKVAKVLTSYFIALRNASDKIEGIDRTPEQPSHSNLQIDVTPIKTLDDVKSSIDFGCDDDIPF